MLYVDGNLRNEQVDNAIRHDAIFAEVLGKPTKLRRSSATACSLATTTLLRRLTQKTR